MGHLIGKGAFGFVYQGLAKGIHPQEKLTTVAIKTVRGQLHSFLLHALEIIYHSRRRYKRRDRKFIERINRNENGRSTCEYYFITWLLYQRRTSDVNC